MYVVINPLSGIAKVVFRWLVLSTPAIFSATIRLLFVKKGMLRSPSTAHFFKNGFAEDVTSYVIAGFDFPLPLPAGCRTVSAGGRSAIFRRGFGQQKKPDCPYCNGQSGL